MTDPDSAPARGAPLAADPLGGAALRFAVLATVLVLVAAAVGASVRLLPWVLDPRIGKETLTPFAESLAVIAIEVAVFTGWPVGWALAAQGLVDRGEARVLASLGESPARTAMRLLPQGAVFAVVLALTSFSLGRMSAAPGRVVDALLQEGHAACARASTPTTSAVPFVGSTWLCGGGSGPRLVGRSPVGGIVYTAGAARVSDDLRRVDLEDARIALATSGTAAVHVHVGTLTLRGLAPFAAASPLAPWQRALVVVLSGAASAIAAVVLLLEMRRGPERGAGFVVAAALGAIGPTSALGALRALELRMPEQGQLGAGWIFMLGAVPIVAVGMVVLGARLASALGVVLERRRSRA